MFMMKTKLSVYNLVEAKYDECENKFCMNICEYYVLFVWLTCVLDA